LCAAQLNIIGLSEQSTILAYSNSTCGTVLQIGAGRSGSFNYTLPLNCYIHGLTFSSVIEGQTNLVYVDGNGGGVSEVTVDSCWFEAWPYLTNYSAASGDLIPIRMEVNLGGPEIITHCFFSYVNAVYWAVDHGVIADNTFNYIGAYSTWAANTPFAWHSGGCGIVVGDPTGPNHYANGNEEWHFDRNFFDNCNGIFDTGSGNMSLAKNPVLNECAWESSQTPVSVFTVTNNPRTWTLVDPILDCPSLTNYMTTASYSLMGPATTNVYVVDLRGPTVSAKSFAGDGSQLTGLNGANMTPGTITTQAVNSAFLALLGNGGAPGNYVVTNSPIITVFTNMTTVGWQPATGAGNSYVQNFASNVTAHIQLRYNAGASAGTTKLDVSIPATTNFCGLSNSWIAGFPSTLGVVDYDVGLDLPLPYGVTVTFKDSSTGGGNSVNFTSCLLEKTSSLWPAVAVTASAPTNISYSSITNPPPKQVFHFVCHLDNPIFTAATNYSALNSTAFSLFPAYYNSPWFMGGIITNVTALAYNIAGIGSGTNLTCGVATNKITDNAMTATINGAGGSNITYYASSGTNSDPVAAGVTNLIFFLNASTNWTGTSARIDVAFDLIWPGISTP
jgi:hypothetical protein